MTRWCIDQDDILGLRLVGSYARNNPRPQSGIDLVVLAATSPGTARAWEPNTEHRLITATGLEIEPQPDYLHRRCPRRTRRR